MIADPPEYLTIAEAAQRTGYTPHHFYRMVAMGRVVGARKIGRDWVIPTPIEIVRLTDAPGPPVGPRKKGDDSL